MQTLKKFFAGKGIGFYAEAGALLFALLGMILFFVTMNLQENMYAFMAVIMVISLLLGTVCLVKDFFGAVSILAVTFYFLSGLFFLVTQLENIGYAITNTNIGDGIMPSFVAGMVMYAVSIVLGIAAVFFSQEKKAK